MIFPNLAAGWHKMLSHPVQTFVIGPVALLILILLGVYFVDYCLATLRAFRIVDELERDQDLKAQVQQLEKATKLGRKKFGLTRKDISAMYAGETRNGLTLKELQRLSEEHERLRAKES